MSLCECGCGQDAGVWTYTNNSLGIVKGQPKRFLGHHFKIKHKLVDTLKMSTKLCGCGCGQDAGRRTGNGDYAQKGLPRNFVPGHHKYDRIRVCCKGHDLTNRDNLTKAGYCRICANAAQKRWGERNPEAGRGKHFQKRYGVSKEQFDEQCIKQGNRCAICSVLFDYAVRENTPTLDHAHDSTGRFRGALCSTCNSGLGLHKDNIQLLESAIQYLKETQWNQFKASFSDMVTKPEVEKT